MEVRRKHAEAEEKQRRGVGRMGISPCSKLVTATSPGQAPLPSPPSKCKLTADKAYGASPALRASVFISISSTRVLGEVQES